MANFEIKNNAILDGSSFKGKVLTIPDEIVEIGEDAFKMTDIEKVIFNANCKKIGNGAFFGCKKLTEVIFPKDSKLRTIEEFAFGDCKSLKTLVLPKKVTKIDNILDDYADIKLHNEIKRIGEFASLGSDALFMVPEQVEKIDYACGYYIFLSHKKEKPSEWDDRNVYLFGVVSDSIIDCDSYRYVIYKEDDVEFAAVFYGDDDSKIIIIPETIDGRIVKRAYECSKKEKKIARRIFLPSSIEIVVNNYNLKNKFYYFFAYECENAPQPIADEYKDSHNAFFGVSAKDLIINNVGVFLKESNTISLIGLLDDNQVITLPDAIDGYRLNKIFRDAICFLDYGSVRLVNFPIGVELEDNAFIHPDSEVFYNIGDVSYASNKRYESIITNPLFRIKITGICTDKKGDFQFLLVNKNDEKEAILFTTVVKMRKFLPDPPKTINGHKVTMMAYTFMSQFSGDEISKNEIISLYENSDLDLV